MHNYIKKLLLLAIVILFGVKFLTMASVMNRGTCALNDGVQYFINNTSEDEVSMLLFEAKRVEDSITEPFTFLLAMIKYILLFMLCFILVAFRNIFIGDHRVKLAQLVPRYFHGGKFKNSLFA
jgi:hypothetical protein